MNARQSQAAKRRRRRGHAVVEAALMMPWLFFVGAGVLDLGYYSYSLVALENATRVAALHTSATTATAADAAGACTYVLREMNGLYNTRSLTACTALPVIVTATSVNGADNSPASQVSVTYQTPQLIPLPWLAGRFTITRVVQMRINNT